MPFPANWTKITVTGTYLDLEGAPVAGAVRFEIAPGPMIDASLKQIIMPKPVIVATLDSNGAFSAALPSTNDPDISPTGLVYTVTESLGKYGTRSYLMQVPFDLVGTLDISSVSPLADAPSVVLDGRFFVKPSPIPNVTGLRSDGTALASLLTALAGLNLITDSTSA